MIKVKHVRTADCAVAGFRWHKSGKDTVGSLLLGLYDGRGVLQRRGDVVVHHGEAKGAGAGAGAPTGDAPRGHPCAAGRRADANAMDRKPGAQSRWSAGKDSPGAAPRRAGVRSEVRPPAGRPVPPRRRLPPLAWSSARGLPLRPARVTTPYELARSSRPDPAALSRPELRRHVPQVTRTRVQVDQRPRIASTSTSAGSRFAAASGWRAFHRSSPASASSLRRAPDLDQRMLRRAGCASARRRTRGGSPCCFS